MRSETISLKELFRFNINQTKEPLICSSYSPSSHPLAVPSRIGDL